MPVSIESGAFQVLGMRLICRQCKNVNYIKHKADDSRHQNEPVAFQCTENRGRQRANALAYGNGHGLSLIRSALFQHGEVQQTHGYILQVGGVLFALHATEPAVEQHLQRNARCKRQNAPRDEPLLFRFGVALGFSELKIGVDDHTVQQKPAGVGNRLCTDALTDKNIGKGVKSLPYDIQPQCKERHDVGFLLKSDADAVHINDGPVYA